MNTPITIQKLIDNARIKLMRNELQFQMPFLSKKEKREICLYHPGGSYACAIGASLPLDEATKADAGGWDPDEILDRVFDSQDGDLSDVANLLQEEHDSLTHRVARDKLSIEQATQIYGKILLEQEEAYTCPK